MCHIPVKVTKGKEIFTMKERFMENGIEYVRCGNYYIPNLMVPECKHEIGKYGRLRRKHLKSSKPCQYSTLLMTGKLFEHLHEKVAAVNAGKAQNPGGNGGTDIGTHNYVNGLLKRHQAGVDKADYHNGGSRRRLNDGGYAQAGKEAGHFTAGEAGQNRSKLVAGALFQSCAHQIHTKQKQTKATDKIQHVENIHIFSFPFKFLRCYYIMEHLAWK